MGTKAVHQCLFCPRMFDNAVEKDDHILEHFPQEICTDCDQSLIRIGNSLYTPHNAVTCIKKESKPVLNSLRESHTGILDENNGAFASSEMICGQYIDIKLESSIEQNEQVAGDDSTDFGEFTNETSTYWPEFDSDDIDFTPSNTVSVQQLEANSNSSTIDRFECKKCNKLFKRREYLEKHTKLKHDPNFIKFDCEFCWAFFKSKESLDHHLRFFCKRTKKTSKEFPSNDKSIATTNDLHMNQSQQVRATNSMEKSSVTNDMESIECSSSVDITSLKVISVQELNIKMEPETQHEQFIPENNKPNDFHSNQMFQGQSHTMPLTNSRPKFECIECCVVFKRKDYLSKHIRWKHNPNTVKYTCEYCFCVYLSPMSLTKHQNLSCIEYKKKLAKMSSGHEKMEACVEATQSENEGTQSKNEGLQFESKETLSENKETRSENEGSQSENKETQSKSKETDKSTTCELCLKKLANKGSLKAHLFLVHSTGDFHTCTRCKIAFRTEGGLKKHLQKCENRSFECYLCHKLYKSKRNIVLHLRMVHLPYRKQFRCKICKVDILCKLEFEMHMNQIHKDMETRNFMCSVCGATFKRKSTWRQHEMAHFGGVKCKFEGCQKTFSSQTSMHAHMRIHRGQKKFRCRIDGCNEQFGGAAGYRKHKLNVHDVPIKK